MTPFQTLDQMINGFRLTPLLGVVAKLGKQTKCLIKGLWRVVHKTGGLHLSSSIGASNILPCYVIEMRPSGGSRLTHATDELPLIHPRAWANSRGEGRQMEVRRLIAAAVTNADHAPCIARPSGHLDHARRHGIDRRASR